MLLKSSQPDQEKDDQEPYNIQVITLILANYFIRYQTYLYTTIWGLDEKLLAWPRYS